MLRVGLVEGMQRTRVIWQRRLLPLQLEEEEEEEEGGSQAADPGPQWPLPRPCKTPPVRPVAPPARQTMPIVPRSEDSRTC